MEALQEQATFSFKDLESNPEKLVEMLLGSNNVSLVIRKQADVVRVFKNVYPEED